MHASDGCPGVCSPTFALLPGLATVCEEHPPNQPGLLN